MDVVIEQASGSDQSSVTEISREDSDQGDSDFVIAPQNGKWQYFAPEKWNDFDELSTQKLEAALRSEAKECVVQVKGASWIIDMQQLFARQGSHSASCIPVHRSEDNWPSPGISWVYQDARVKEWVHFRAAVSEVIETAFKQHQATINVLVLGDEWFSILFKYNLALNKHGRYRHVRRSQVSVGWEVFLSARSKWLPLEGIALSDPEALRVVREVEFEDGVLDIPNMRYLHVNGDTYGVRRCCADTRIFEEVSMILDAKEKCSSGSEKQTSTMHEDPSPHFSQVNASAVLLDLSMEDACTYESIPRHERPRRRVSHVQSDPADINDPGALSPSRQHVFPCEMQGEHLCQPDSFHVQRRPRPSLPTELGLTLGQALLHEDVCLQEDSFRVQPRTSRGQIDVPESDPADTNDPGALSPSRQHVFPCEMQGEYLCQPDSFHVKRRPRPSLPTELSLTLGQALLHEDVCLQEDSFRVQPRTSRGQIDGPERFPCEMQGEYLCQHDSFHVKRPPRPSLQAELSVTLDKALLHEEVHCHEDSFHVLARTPRGQIDGAEPNLLTETPPGLRQQLSREADGDYASMRPPQRQKAAQAKRMSLLTIEMPFPDEAPSCTEPLYPPRRHSAPKAGQPSQQRPLGQEALPTPSLGSRSRVEAKGVPPTAFQASPEKLTSPSHMRRRPSTDVDSNVDSGWFVIPKASWAEAPAAVRQQVLENLARKGALLDDREDAEETPGMSQTSSFHSGSDVQCLDLLSLIMAPQTPPPDADDYILMEQEANTFYETNLDSSWDIDLEAPSSARRVTIATDTPPGHTRQPAAPLRTDPGPRHRSKSHDARLPSRPSWAQVQPRIDANNLRHKPGGGHVVIPRTKLDWSKVRPRIDADNKDHTPGGGRVEIANFPVRWAASAKVDHDNRRHKPGGGHVTIINQPLHWEAQPTVPRARTFVPRPEEPRALSKGHDGSDSSESLRSSHSAHAECPVHITQHRHASARGAAVPPKAPKPPRPSWVEPPAHVSGLAPSPRGRRLSGRPRA